MKLPFQLALRILLTLLLLLLSGQATVSADDAVPTEPTLRWWRGNIHTHSLWSDGDDFPEMIAEWYRTNEYNFLALTDHNVMSQGMRWMKLDSIESRGGANVLTKYQARFGADWVESRGEPGTEAYAIRLKPLDEFRGLVEQRGKFIMIPGEEVSDSSEGVPLHMNATNLSQVIEPVGGATVREAMRNNLRAVEEQAKRAGREILMHLNHPNFGYAITAEDIAAVVQERFFEVYNGHPAVGQLGDEHHPSIERMWDIANTIRIGELNAAPIMGVATDDSHHYHGKPDGSLTGRGWVMVRSKYLTPEHLLRAMKAGDFYASSGVTLNDVVVDKAAGKLTVTIAPVAGETYTTHFIGTRKLYDANSTPRELPSSDDPTIKKSTTEKRKNRPPPRLTRKYSSDVGATLATVQGTTATYSLRGDELYVRAMIVSSASHTNPSFADQKQQAWTQPWVSP